MIKVKYGKEEIEIDEHHLHRGAFNLGFGAFFGGKLDNPYYKHTIGHKEWMRGFDAGYAYNLRKLPRPRLTLPIKPARG